MASICDRIHCHFCVHCLFDLSGPILSDPHLVLCSPGKATLRPWTVVTEQLTYWALTGTTVLFVFVV